MSAYREAIVALLLLLFTTSCSEITPVQCLRFDTGPEITLSDLANFLYEHDDSFAIDSYNESFTQRQQAAGASWIVARRDEVEVSMQSHHDWGFSDICVYDHSNGEQTVQAMQALNLLSDQLDVRNIAYEYL